MPMNTSSQKVILFGSRARGDNWERSDIDLAVSGGRHSPICAGSGRRGVNAAAV
ncbi:nucleotidyltransferase domain-containing protein [Ruminococcus sp.]|uniref:nucleotidyltransferase domain-containing protein n=1 Tax=Ruminococcus sp. TaxID=41978 RepID=UPI00338E3865